MAGMALMPIGYMVVSVFFLAFICRMVQGASLAFSNTTAATIATDIIPKPRFAEGMGMFGLATALATAIAPPERRGGANSTFLCAYDIGLGIGGGISGAFIDGVGYQKMFCIMVVFNIISVIIYILIGRSHPSSFRNRIQKSA